MSTSAYLAYAAFLVDSGTAGTSLLIAIGSTRVEELTWLLNLADNAPHTSMASKPRKLGPAIAPGDKN